MDSGLNWEHKIVVLINKLIQGIELTKRLRACLSSVASTSDGTQELLLHKILSSFEQSLSIVKGSGGSTSQTPQPPLSTTARAVESPVSANASPRTDDMNKRSFNGHQEIIDSSKRRSYFSCTNRESQGCMARKQVQREDDDPTVFVITYRGSHNCFQATIPTPPEIHPTEQSNQLFLDFTVNANDADTNPSTSSSCQMNSSFGTGHSFQQSDSYRTDCGLVLNLYHSESDRTDIYSANTSTTTSSIMDDFTHPSLGATSKLPVCLL